MIHRIARGAAVAATLTLTLAAPASAHSDPNLAGGLVAGVLHPISGPDHLLAMVAVGLWGAFLGRPLIILLPTVFPAMMAVGGMLGMIGVPAPPTELGISASVIVLGAAIAARWRPPAVVALLVVAIFALFHGYAHGAELPSIADPVAYSLGFVVATGCLHLIGIAIGLIERRRHGATAIRVMGGIIMAAGGWFLASALG